MARFHYEHNTSEEWLLARREVVTATELVDLMVKPRANSFLGENNDINPKFLKLWGEKNSNAPVETAAPSSDAARGHILEPYAVREFNALGITQPMYHWDDVIITNMGVGFSPDAMNIKQNTKKASIQWTEAPATEILEIKSYGIKHHMEDAVTPKNKLKQRYQIAVAMAVNPTIQRGWLALFNPDAPIALEYKCWAREELAKEMKELENTFNEYRKFVSKMEKDYERCKVSITEEKIYEEYLDSMKPIKGIGGSIG